jgi:uncharacterized protein YjbI with pentapeptide repeats
MEQDFSGQNLQGRKQKFKGLDLTDANFSYADIRGVDFTGAILREANFSHAIAGLTSNVRIYLVILSFLGLLILGFLAAVSGAYTIERITTNFLDWKIQVGFAAGISLILFAIFSVISFREGFIAAVIFLITAIVIASVLSVGFARAEVILKEAKMLAEIISAIAAQFAAVSAVACIATLPEVILTVVLSKNLAIAITILGLISAFFIGVSAAISAQGFAGGFVTGAIVLLGGGISFCFYRQILGGDRQQELVKTIAIYLCAWQGTSFQNADLADADFSEAILNNTNFQNAHLIRTCWQRVKYIQFANLKNTYLKNLEIRNLLVTGVGENKNFDAWDLRELNLSGANFKNASLIGTNFYQSNLRKVSFFGAKLVHGQFEGADLTGATLTGACIENWLVTRSTKLQAIDCKYIFLKYIDGDKRDQIPPYNEFEEGEFILFIRSILDTIDLYHEREINPIVAVSVLKSLSDKYQQTFDIVGCFRKDNGAIVLQLKTSDWSDREQLKEDYYSRYSQGLSLFMQDPKAYLQPDLKQSELKALVRKLNNALENLKQLPNNKTHLTQNITIENSQVYGDVNVIQGDNNHLLMTRTKLEEKLIDAIAKVEAMLSNTELPPSTKQEMVQILKEAQNYLLIEEESRDK